MRWLVGSIASLLLVTLEIACSTVSPDECWVNTSGGFGGGGTIPIGAGVGATSGGDSDSPPPRGPLDASGTANPCIDAPSEGDGLFGSIRCRKSEYGMTCADRCGNAGMFCADLRPHPYKSDGGIGKASGCDGDSKGTTCVFYYPQNGDMCYFYPKKKTLCRYEGG